MLYVSDCWASSWLPCYWWKLGKFVADKTVLWNFWLRCIEKDWEAAISLLRLKFSCHCGCSFSEGSSYWISLGGSYHGAALQLWPRYLTSSWEAVPPHNSCPTSSWTDEWASKPPRAASGTTNLPTLTAQLQTPLTSAIPRQFSRYAKTLELLGLRISVWSSGKWPIFFHKGRAVPCRAICKVSFKKQAFDGQKPFSATTSTFFSTPLE